MKSQVASLIHQWLRHVTNNVIEILPGLFFIIWSVLEASSTRILNKLLDHLIQRPAEKENKQNSEKRQNLHVNLKYKHIHVTSSYVRFSSTKKM